MKTVIIGNGIAGNQVAFRLRQSLGLDEVCLLSAEGFAEYDPCSLPYFLGGDIPESAVFRRRLDAYQQQGIQLLLNCPVVSITPQDKFVTTATGLQITYDQLVLAHGGDLFVPPIPGLGGPGVFSCKQLAETEKLRRHQGKRAVVIGSGAIGIEAAEALHKNGYEVAIVELLEWIMPTLFDRETSWRLENALREFGVQVYASERVLGVDRREGVVGVVTDKRTIPCDTVVMATGVVPGVALAKTAGINTGRGILVDAGMRTSVPDIYACGDCVETVDLCTGESAMFQLKHNAIDQANVVAANLQGKQARYPGAYAFARIHFGKTHAGSFGKTTKATQCHIGELEIVEKVAAGNYLRLILKDGLILGGQAIGRYADYLGFFMSAMWRRDRFVPRRNFRLVPTPSSMIHHWPRQLITELLGS